MRHPEARPDVQNGRMGYYWNPSLTLYHCVMILNPALCHQVPALSMTLILA